MYFVRHAQTVWNSDFDPSTMTCQGVNVENIDLVKESQWFSLTDLGIRQAENTANRLVDILGNDLENGVVYSSTLNQAIESVSYFFNKLPGFRNRIIYCDDLREYNMGSNRSEEIDDALIRFSKKIDMISRVALEDRSVPIVYTHGDILSMYISYLSGMPIRQNIGNADIIKLNPEENIPISYSHFPNTVF